MPSYEYKHSFLHATFNFLLDFPGIEPKNSFLIFSGTEPKTLYYSRGLCDELITRPEESYRLWCVVVCDLEKTNLVNEEGQDPLAGFAPKGKKKFS